MIVGDSVIDGEDEDDDDDGITRDNDQAIDRQPLIVDKARQTTMKIISEVKGIVDSGDRQMVATSTTSIFLIVTFIFLFAIWMLSWALHLETIFAYLS